MVTTIRKGKKSVMYTISASNFYNIPGNPIAYWISKSEVVAFTDGEKLQNLTQCAAGVSSGDNEKYLKLWFEINFTEIGQNLHSNREFMTGRYKYAFCNKGGECRKWYGNNEYVALWCKQAEFHRNGATYVELLFVEGMTWSAISTGAFNARYYPKGFIFDHASPSLFPQHDGFLLYFLGLTNSVVCDNFLSLINPTLNTGADTLRKIPVFIARKEKVDSEVEDNICISKKDWDSFETSWEFKKHPLI